MPLIITCKVTPRSGRTLCILGSGDNLKCYLKSPPEKGKANKELIVYFASALKIPQNLVELIGGATSRTKRLKIDKDLTFEQLLAVLGIEVQKKLFE